MACWPLQAVFDLILMMLNSLFVGLRGQAAGNGASVTRDELATYPLRALIRCRSLTSLLRFFEKFRRALYWSGRSRARTDFEIAFDFFEDLPNVTVHRAVCYATSFV